MTRPLGYLFWHRPQPGVTGYEGALADFHRSLLDEPPPGFVNSWTWRVEAPPWFAGAAPTYLDVYATADLSTLSDLEEAAVSGHRRLPHDRAAALTATGAGALMQAVAGQELTCSGAVLSFVDKPAGTDRDGFVAGLAGAGGVISVWMRRLVLGPGPEFLVVSTEAPAPHAAWSSRAEATITAGGNDGTVTEDR